MRLAGGINQQRIRKPAFMLDRLNQILEGGVGNRQRQHSNEEGHTRRGWSRPVMHDGGLCGRGSKAITRHLLELFQQHEESAEKNTRTAVQRTGARNAETYRRSQSYTRLRKLFWSKQD